MNYQWVRVKDVHYRLYRQPWSSWWTATLVRWIGPCLISAIPYDVGISFWRWATHIKYFHYTWWCWVSCWCGEWVPVHSVGPITLPGTMVILKWPWGSKTVWCPGVSSWAPQLLQINQAEWMLEALIQFLLGYPAHFARALLTRPWCEEVPLREAICIVTKEHSPGIVVSTMT